MRPPLSLSASIVASAALLSDFGPGVAVAATPEALATDLQRGGYIILMRHMSSPMAPPDSQAADPQNVDYERQLDDKGRADAKAFGEALRRVAIPIGRVWTSPAYRARETAELADLPTPQTVPELAERSNSMTSQPDAKSVAWLINTSASKPADHSNTIIITHMPNIAAAFPAVASGLSAGDAIILKPNGRTDEIIGTIKVDQWPGLHSR